MSLNTPFPNSDRTQGISPEQITELLTLSAEQMESSTVEALRQSRQTALEKQASHVRRFSLTTGNGMHWPTIHPARHWAAILLAAAIAVSAGYWQHVKKHEMMANLDVAILTDNIPMEVFLDR